MNGLITQLSMLESSGLVSLSAVEPDLIYAFRHPLMQEIAYQSLTREDRRRLHWTIGAALEKTYPDRLAELAPILGEHFDKAGDKMRALEYYRMAGHTAQRKYANPEAIQYYRRGLKIALVGKPGFSTTDDALIDLCRNLGRVLELSGQQVEALRHYQEMEEYARQIENRPLELAAILARVTVLSTPTFVLNPNQARELSGRALELAHDLRDEAAEAKIYWNLLLVNFFSYNFTEAKSFGEKSLALARALKLREQLAYTLNDLGSYVYQATGENDLAIQSLDEARLIFKELENLPMLTDNLANTSSIYFTMGEFEKARRLIDEAYQTSKSIGNLWGQAYSRGLLGFLCAYQGKADRAFSYLEESLRLGKASGFAGVLTISHCLMGFMYANLGLFEKGIRTVREAMQMGGEISNFWVDQAYGCLAFLYALQGKYQEADEAIRQSRLILPDAEIFFVSCLIIIAGSELRLQRGDYQGLLDYITPFIERLRKNGELAFLPDCLYYAGNALLGMDRWEEARLLLVEAEGLAQSLEIHRIRWQALAALAEEAFRREEGEIGLKWLVDARQEATWMAEHTGSDELRDSFLQLECVRRLDRIGT